MTAGNIITYVLAGALVGYIIYNFLRSRKQLNKPPSENVKELTDENFKSVVKTGISLVDFWAAWCGPCRVQGPIIDELADELKDEVNICKLNIDEQKKVASELGIQSIPTILLFKDGKVVDKFVGVKPKQVLLSAINSHI